MLNNSNCNIKIKKMRRILFPFLLILFISCSNNTKKTSITNIDYSQEKNFYSCDYKGVTRTFTVYLPEKTDKNTSLILMLHGLSGSAVSFRKDTHMDSVANPRNYAVVYVEGIVDPAHKSYGKGWHYLDDEFSRNDTAFINELALYCQKTYNLGPKLFIAGYSNGGFMVNKIASTKGSVFTGAASVCGTMQKPVWESKNTKKSVGFIQINGTLDDVVPMEFTGSAKKNPQSPSMETIIKYFCKLNKVSEEYKTIDLSAKATLLDFNEKVRWVIIKEGRHSWPQEQFSGFDTASVIVDFFDTL